MKNDQKKHFSGRQIVSGLLIFVWFAATFVLAQLAMQYAVGPILAATGLINPENPTTFQQVLYGSLTYAVMFGLVVGVPWLLWRHKTSREDLGLQRLPQWSEILLPFAAFIGYLIIGAVVLNVLTQLIPAFNANQAQDLGFGAITSQSQLLLIFVMVVVVAPVVEEVLFRGYLYGKLRSRMPMWAAALLVSALFGLFHGQWNVAVDTFLLSLVLIGLREVTGSLWPAIVLHMIKNGLAFVLVFVLG